jgi:hypothetical protein
MSLKCDLASKNAKKPGPRLRVQERSQPFWILR